MWAAEGEDNRQREIVSPTPVAVMMGDRGSSGIRGIGGRECT